MPDPAKIFRCRKCRYWDTSMNITESQRERNDENMGLCRKHPPRADYCSDSVFPMVKGDQWCSFYNPVD